MTTPIQQMANRQIGVVESISPIEVKVNLDVEAPHSIAMGTRNPQLFPRLNGFLLIPCESGFIVGRIGWLSIEPSPYPKRKGVRDFGILDLPFPSRKLKLNMLGILKPEDSQTKYEFTRGVHSFPALGDSVLLPDRDQLRSIIESGTNGKIKIGTCPLADDADVKIDPNKLFGRHLAVLGNTGSGKSCTVSGLIRWSLESAQKHIEEKPNARFIILDPNGEYSDAFQKFKPKVFKVYPDKSKEQKQGQQLQVPAWFWNSNEWSSITQASSKTQIPLLRRALRAMRVGGGKEINIQEEIKNFLRILLTSIREDKRKGTCFGNFPGPKNLSKKMEIWKTSVESFFGKGLQNDLEEILKELVSHFNQVYSNHNQEKYYPSYSVQEIDKIINKIDSTFQAFGGSEKDFLQIGEDTPIKFNEKDFINHIEYLIQESKESYFDFFLIRIKTIFSDTRMKKIVSDSEAPITLEEWLNSYIGDDSEDSLINIIDLSLVPKDIIYLVTAVISRMIFEALQRYKSEEENKNPLPTVLVMEEAHTFIQKYKKDSEEFSAGRLCTEMFERIAKEGRKFGLGLVLSSQRPSELSQTVLSQCNTFLLHRITNDRDQEMVSRLLPDSLKGTMQELPALPTRHAYLLGWASEIPILTEIAYLPKESRPKSDDPDFWNVWIRKQDRTINWKDIAKKWQGNGAGNKQSS